MALRDDLLPAVNIAPTLLTEFGINRHSITVRTRTWTGSDLGAEVGTGSYTDDDLEISPNPEVVEQEGGARLKVTMLVPQYSGGGYTPEQLNPTPDLEDGQQVLYVVTSPSGTRNYVIDDIDTSDPFEHVLYLRALDRKVPY